MLVHTIKELRDLRKSWDGNLTVGIVPTMGALHEGHLSLIRKAKSTCDKVVVSVFVNPIQFGPSEDFDKYPRTLEKDVELCKSAGVDVVFAPSPNEMYGGKCESTGSNESKPDAYEEGNRLSNDTLTYVCPPFFYVNKLCGKSRVGHFDGVCTGCAQTL